MELKLYKCVDSPETLNKSISLSAIINIKPRADFNIYSPTVVLDIDPLLLSDINYAVIPELNRNYFVTELQDINGKFWRLEMKCDVLETYKETVLNSVSIYERDIKAGDYSKPNYDDTRKTLKKYESNITLNSEGSILVSTIITNKKA